MKDDKNTAQMNEHFECNICEETFDTRQQLEAHNRQFHSPKAEHSASRQPSGAEKNPGMDMSKKGPQHSQTDRKGQGSEEQTERPDQMRKRAAS